MTATAARPAREAAAATDAPVRMPPGPRTTPRGFLRFYTDRTAVVTEHAARFGPTFTATLPGLGRTVVLTEPALFRELFRASDAVAGSIEPSLDVLFGAGSIFGKQEVEHRRHRKLLVPPFHGRSLRAFEEIVREEAERELATWPLDTEFPVHPATTRMTLNIILRALFGAAGDDLDALRALAPRWVRLGATLFALRPLRVDLGPGSPWRRHLRMRAEFDALVGRLADRALADPAFDERTDVLSLLLRARYDDGSAMTRTHIADELITLVAAGHETTATELAWAFERLRRHPDVLERLVADLDDPAGGEYVTATVEEVLRTRPTIDGTVRQVLAERMAIGDWVVPRGTTVYAATSVAHRDPRNHDRPGEFSPERFVGDHPDPYDWTPFGGGTRRCVGAAFATMEMDVILRTVLGAVSLEPTDAPDERIVFRGLPYAPGAGGLVRLRRRPGRALI